jgi:hypothetical protein
VNGLSASISGVGRAIGHYFSVVSFIPSLFLVSFTFTLIESGAWGAGALHWARAGDAFTHVGNLALLVGLSLALGIAVHPVQFSLVQFFEGYWGTGRLAQRLRVARIKHHLARFRFLRFEDRPKARQKLRGKKGMRLAPTIRIRYLSIADESDRMLARYPENDDDIMPTRLGNVLRRYERLAGYQYGLSAVTAIRHIALVADPQRLDYLNDQRQQLDLAVRMSATSVIATCIAISALWRHGPWLLIALGPYAIAYLSYRGAVVAAQEYGAAVSTIIDLDRFTFYQRLRMQRPENTAAERLMNKRLMALIDYMSNVSLPYEYPPATEDPENEMQAK